MVGKTELIFSISEKAISFCFETSDTPSLTFAEGSFKNLLCTASVSSEVDSGFGSSEKYENIFFKKPSIYIKCIFIYISKDHLHF